MTQPAPRVAAPAGDRRPLPYVPALDGLRAVAVVGVMLFHGGVAWMPGGFLGVDVFFVLSGYLITTLLLRERVGTHTIDLRQFWVRRLRRLLPALIVLIGAVGIAAPFLIDPGQRASVRGDGLAALGYVANWRFIVTEQSYFAGVPSPLRHLWSLAVEEQWYVLFPIVVAVGLRRPRRIRLFIVGLAAAAVASAVWMAV
ncbi:MAG TPA: acyltransferase, partial [Iamia sp.]|nr:acyltransferase [Iamia sp.]